MFGKRTQRNERPGAAGGGSGGAGVSKGLDEASLSNILDELRASWASLGIEDPRTLELRARFDSTLAQWQLAAQEAAEKDDFAESERISDITYKYAELGQALGAGADVARQREGSIIQSALTPSQSAATQPAGGRTDTDRTATTSRRGRRRSSKDRAGKDAHKGSPGEARMPDSMQGSQPTDRSANAAFDPWGSERAGRGPTSFDAAFAGFGTDEPIGESHSAFPPAFPHDLGDASAGFDGGFSGPCGDFSRPGDGGMFGAASGEHRRPVGESAAACASAASDAPPSEDGLVSPPADAASQHCRPLASPNRPAVAAASTNPFASSGQLRQPEGNDGSSDVLATQSLLHQLDGALRREAESRETVRTLTEQVQRANRRLRDLEPVEAQLADSRASLLSLREANMQLENEVDVFRRQAREAHKLKADAEEQLVDREAIISNTRQRLFDERHRNEKLEDDLRNMTQHQECLKEELQRWRASAADRSVLGSDAAAVPDPRRGSVPYSRGPSGGFPSSRVPMVSQHDELADSSAQGSTGRDSSSPSPRRSISDAPSARGLAPVRLLPRTPADEWARTPWFNGPPGALVARMPPASADIQEKVGANFRKLLTQSRGPLYQDERITMEMIISAPSGPSRPGIPFDVAIVNRGAHPINQVTLRANLPVQSHACSLRIEQLPGGGAVGGVLWQQQHLRFRGWLETYGPFDVGPEVVLTYMLPDDMCLKAVVRLPLTIARLMKPPTQFAPARFVELWESMEFARTEVAVVCHIRRSLVVAGTGPLAVGQCLEFGGALRCVHGTDESPRSVALVSAYPQHPGTPSEVLVRAEVGTPPANPSTAWARAPGAEARLCRVAVRSASHLVSRALLQALVDALCASPEPAAAA